MNNYEHNNEEAAKGLTMAWNQVQNVQTQRQVLFKRTRCRTVFLQYILSDWRHKIARENGVKSIVRNILRNDSHGYCHKSLLRNEIRYRFSISVLNDQSCSSTTGNKIYNKANRRPVLNHIMNLLENGRLIHHSRMNKRCFSKYRINA